MRISNVELARIVSDRGYDFHKVLDGLDMGRSPEQEKTEEYTEEDIIKLIDSICLSFECEKETVEWDREEQEQLDDYLSL